MYVKLIYERRCKFKTMARRRRKKNSKKVIISTIVLVGIIALATCGYVLYEHYFNSDNVNNPDDGEDEKPSYPTELGKVNVTSKISWNNEFNISKESVFYQYNQEEIESYYSSVDFNLAKDVSKKEEVFTSLYDLLSKDFNKLNYDGKNSFYEDTNFTWANYVIADRDFNLSPLTEDEVKKNGRNKDVYLDILYRQDNILFKSSLGSDGLLDREHILPKSYGFNNEGTGYQKLDAGCDLHNLRSADHKGNSTGHNNRLYDDISTLENINEVYDPDNKSVSYYNDSYFEPPSEDKGEIARAVFYMALKYRYYEEGNDILTEGPSIRLSDDAIKIDSTIIPSDTKDNSIEFGKLSTLLKWNEEDPVNENEMIRNNIVYNLQGNRNPFVDYPNLANLLFIE